MANGALAESIHGVRTIQGEVRENVNYGLYTDLCNLNCRTHLKAAKLAQVNIPVVDTLTGAAMAIIVIIGGRMVLSDELALGVMVAFLFYVQRFFDPIRSLTIQYSMMQRATVSGQRILEVLDVPKAIPTLSQQNLHLGHVVHGPWPVSGRPPAGLWPASGRQNIGPWLPGLVPSEPS